MDVALRSEAFSTGNHEWLASQHGVESPISGTLDRSGFTEGTHYPNGYVPAGLILGQLASGMYVPYNDLGTGGAEVAVAVLLFDVPVTEGSTGDLAAPILRHGFIRAANLPIAEGTTGGLDAGTDARGTLAQNGIYVEG